MRSVGLIFLVVLGLSVPGQVWAGWTYATSKDELRRSETVIATLRPVSGGDAPGLGLTELVFTHGPSGTTAFFLNSQGNFSCPSSGCEVPARFDDAKVVTLKGVSLPGNDVIGLPAGEVLIEAVRLSRQLIVELPTRNNGPTQFKFVTTGLDWPEADVDQPFGRGFGRLHWGDPVPPELKELTTKPTNKTACYKGAFPDDGPWNVSTAEAVAYCFVGGRFAYISIRSAATAAGISGLRDIAKALLGKPEISVADYTKWGSGAREVVVDATLFGGGLGKKPSGSLLLITFNPMQYFKSE